MGAEETDLLEPQSLNTLISHISSLASVYHKPPTNFLEPGKGRGLGASDPNSKNNNNTGAATNDQNAGPQIIQDANAVEQTNNVVNSIVELIDLDFTGNSGGAADPVPQSQASTDLDNILGGLGISSSPVTTSAAPAQSNPMDLLSGLGMGGPSQPATVSSSQPSQSVNDLLGGIGDVSAPVTSSPLDANDIFGLNAGVTTSQQLHARLPNLDAKCKRSRT